MLNNEKSEYLDKLTSMLQGSGMGIALSKFVEMNFSVIQEFKKFHVPLKKQSEIISISINKPVSSFSIIEFLQIRGNMRPRTITTLSNSITNIFMKKLEVEELAGLVEELVKRKVVVKNGNKVSYHIPTIN
jgi:hypothetical protein